MNLQSSRAMYMFMLRVLAFFAVSLYVWYILAFLHLAPVVWLVGQFFQLWMPEAVLGLRLQEHHILMLITNFDQIPSGQIVTPPPANDALGFPSNPLIYGYGIPLFVALLWATPVVQKGKKILIGLSVLLVVEMLCMVFVILKTLLVEIGTIFVEQQGFNDATLLLIGFCYQQGILIVPMLLPLLLWMALCRDFLLQLVPQFGKVFTQS